MPVLTKPQAISTLCAAAAWLRVSWHNDDCRRNDGWDRHYAEQAAYELLLRLAREVREDG